MEISLLSQYSKAQDQMHDVAQRLIAADVAKSAHANKVTPPIQKLDAFDSALVTLGKFDALIAVFPTWATLLADSDPHTQAAVKKLTFLERIAVQHKYSNLVCSQSKLCQ